MDITMDAPSCLQLFSSVKRGIFHIRFPADAVTMEIWVVTVSFGGGVDFHDNNPFSKHFPWLHCQHDLDFMTPTWAPVTLNSAWYPLVADRIEGQSQCWNVVIQVSPECFVWTPVKAGSPPGTEQSKSWQPHQGLHFGAHTVLKGTFIS